MGWCKPSDSFSSQNVKGEYVYPLQNARAGVRSRFGSLGVLGTGSDEDQASGSAIPIDSMAQE